MPYRIDLDGARPGAFDRLIDLGALDVAAVAGGIAAIMPDGVDAALVADALGIDDLRVSPARGRDDGSIWVLNAGPVQAGPLLIAPAEWPEPAGALRMIDGPAFGTGLHPTTALCLEAIADEVALAVPAGALDVGTGSGILALAALRMNVPRVVAIDIDADAVRVASVNAALNGLASRLLLVRAGPQALAGTWPLVVANVLAAPLMDMAPAVARCVARGGRLVLSGIRSSLAQDVEQAYRRTGMSVARTLTRDGWTALILQCPR